MNCSDVQEALFAADSVSGQSLPAPLLSHLRTCSKCAALRMKLIRLEAAARALPELQGSSQAKQQVLNRLRPRRVAAAPLLRHLRFFLETNWRPKAVAASVLLALAALLWIGSLRQSRPPLATNSSSPSSPLTTSSPSTSVIDRLVDLNLDLANAPPSADRNKIFAEQAAPLNSTIEKQPLAQNDRELANALLANSKRLSSDTDPFDDAESLGNVADLLFDQVQEAASSGDPNVIARVTRRYGMVAQRLEESRAKLAKSSHANPQRKRQYERLVRRQSDIASRLTDLLKRAPAMSSDQIRQELNNIPKVGTKRKH